MEGLESKSLDQIINRFMVR